MWTDSETDRDFVNFTGVADTVAEIVLEAKGSPVSIGVSGEWGVGKSSMIRLIRRSLNHKTGGGQSADAKRSDYLFVEFNAWLYQGYDDARAALMEVIASALESEAEKRKTGLEKAKEFVKRVNVLRLVRLTASTAASLALGLPPVGLIGEVAGLMAAGRSGKVDGTTLEKAVEVGERVGAEAGGLINPKEIKTPPQEIQAIRDAFQEVLQELGVTLVVFIDDLDRCLPHTTISTLEAIRLFLFMPRTAFIIAADEAMIKHAVRVHFEKLTADAPVISYFDKLIQVPVRVPPLGTQEVRAYLIMLAAEKQIASAEDREKLRAAICAQLARTWKGDQVNLAFVKSAGVTVTREFEADVLMAERLAPLLTSAPNVKGNPRLIKRFMNALSIRRTIARRHEIAVDDAVLIKMLLFERNADIAAYRQIAGAVNADPQGHAKFIAEWERTLEAGKSPDLTGEWDNDFSRQWLQLPPQIGNADLRGVLYLSREHVQVVSPGDRLSAEGSKVLEGLLKQPAIASTLSQQIKALAAADKAVVMDRLLEDARREEKWGALDILKACLVVADEDPAQAAKLGAFLAERPHSQIEASIVPVLFKKAWATSLIAGWEASSTVGKHVKNAIAAARRG